MYDHGLIERTAVPEIMLLPPALRTPQAVLRLSPNIHLINKKGLERLVQEGYELDEANRKVYEYDVSNATFLAHELQRRDLRIWLAQCERVHGGKVETYRYSVAGHMEPARPDGVFVYELPCNPPRRVVGFIEADRGTGLRGDP